MDHVVRQNLCSVWGKDLEEAYRLIRDRYLDYRAKMTTEECYAVIYVTPKRTDTRTFGVGALFCATPLEALKLLPPRADIVAKERLTHYPNDAKAKEILDAIWRMVNPDKRPTGMLIKEGEAWLS